MTATISKELYDVLVAWREDAMSAEPSHRARCCGLCSYTIHQSGAGGGEVKDLLNREFGDNSKTPFNLIGDAYTTSAFKGTQHLNPRRRAWVDAKIAEYEAAHASEVAVS